MKIRIAQKDIIGYVFLLVVSAACITIGIRSLQHDHPASGVFGLALGVALIAAVSSMALRKE